jgi:gliding motility-associated protein GldM
MINLMYVLLMAMLALNVSSDVLNGFTLVDESLTKSTENSTEQNRSLYRDFAAFMEQNPEKVQEWFNRAQTVKQMSDSLYEFADYLKERIAKKADGPDGDYRNLKNREDLEASTYIMLGAGREYGAKLYDAINNYRERILTMISDTIQRQVVTDLFNTEVPKRDITMLRNWQEYNFENMPAIAAITLLTKLQSWALKRLSVRNL